MKRWHRSRGEGGRCHSMLCRQCKYSPRSGHFHRSSSGQHVRLGRKRSTRLAIVRQSPQPGQRSAGFGRRRPLRVAVPREGFCAGQSGWRAQRGQRRRVQSVRLPAQAWFPGRRFAGWLQRLDAVRPGQRQRGLRLQRQQCAKGRACHGQGHGCGPPAGMLAAVTERRARRNERVEGWRVSDTGQFPW